MTSIQSIDRYLTRANLSGVTYAVLVVICCLTTLFMVTDIARQYLARSDSLEMLSRLDGRNHFGSAEHGGTKWPPGSPFLEGQTVTVASAALLQRITGVITNAGGTVVSTEMQQQGARTKDGYVTAIANCELGAEELQRVLYDIEAGLPFLFVDQLVVQTPSPPAEGARLRVMLAVAGLWPGER
jgi:general secretion pathway protein M